MSAVPPVDAGAETNDALKGPAAGFGLAAVIAILFDEEDRANISRRLTGRVFAWSRRSRTLS